MRLDEINKIAEYIKEQTDHKGDIFININNNAIPVLWLKKLAYTLKDNGHYSDYTFLIDVIDKWEKENENKY